MGYIPGMVIDTPAAVQRRLSGRSLRRSRTWRPVTIAIVAISLTLFVAQLAWFAAGGVAIIMPDWDRGHYMDAALRFVDAGTPYLASEVAAPFDYVPLTFLHPPLALWLMVPFAYLPAAAWYIVPIVIVAWCLLAWRPSPLAWAVVALCLLWPRTPALIVTGGTDMWATAVVALGLRFGWPGPLLMIKPSLAPLLLAGINRGRAWWLGWVLVVVLSIPFGALWLDWIQVLLHAPGGLLYSALAIPGVALPLAAWLGRRRDDDLASASTALAST